ncbi:pentapeptide repeat-containing protein [Salinicoccus hispanicus]|uniref:Pentapeptide repeat-containing protein n=1 Tax=Salinicoccus hispanicus TaxID=157225 RepID=A0A6N8TUT7_9STAP|nr:pentapeptide repeat-containing protein [Salinicoccus hispanicus]MXQ49678.1 pentapeptide repeat-containing protein [Salinicoccus hispanicus]
MKRIPPKLSASLEQAKFNHIFLDEDHMLENREVIDSEFANGTMDRLKIHGSVVRGCNFSESTFTDTDLLDVRFVDCDLSNVNFSKASIHRVEFINCKLVGSRFDECSIKNLLFKESILNLAVMSEGKLENILFETCRMGSTDFFDCKMKKVVFDDCELDEARFIDTSLNGIDISTSHFETFDIKKEDLEGCIVSSTQLIQFASMLGLVVKN